MTHDSERAVSWQASVDRHIFNVNYMLERVDPGKIDKFLSVMRECAGLLMFTGVGQNALLAHKVAATYASLGLRAHSMDAVALLHGGLGMVRREDVLIMLSHSGETVELTRLAETCQHMDGPRTVAVHAATTCQLARLCTHAVHVPMVGEADHIGIAPTASSACFLILLQAVAVHMAGEAGLTSADFTRTHPAGAIGGGRW